MNPAKRATMMPAVDPRYPIGKFEPPASFDAGLRAGYAGQIAAAPALLRAAVADLSDSQLDTPYREGGWTVRQVVHHLPDSHVNAYVRFKLALTEDQPLIRTYDEVLWAELPEARGGALEPSLALLEALHARWLACIRSLPEVAFARTFRHPDLGLLSLDRQLALYSWHGRHHVAHVTRLRETMGWGAGAPSVPAEPARECRPRIGAATSRLGGAPRPCEHRGQ